MIGPDFRVIEKVGEGTYCNAYSCVDKKTQDVVIIKACRSKKENVEAAEDEIKTMHKLNQLDPHSHFFVRYYGHFIFEGHTCIVYEKLGYTLFHILESHDFRPFSTHAVRSFMWQIINALHILHTNGIVHTDLKLENILLKYERMIDRDGFDMKTQKPSTGIKLIDFGSSDSGTHWHKHLVTTRHYRAPEILMGLKWGYECDIWSLGCILAELSLGDIEFDSKDLVEHLFLIQHMIGPIPISMWSRCTKRELCGLARDGILRIEDLPVDARRYCARKPHLSELLSFDPYLADLALSMLNPNMFKRPTTADLLRHRFFSEYRDRRYNMH